MRAYTLVTGIVFAILVAVHLARIALEGLHVLREPFFVVSTAIAAALSLWAMRLWLAGRAR